MVFLLERYRSRRNEADAELIRLEEGVKSRDLEDKIRTEIPCSFTQGQNTLNMNMNMIHPQEEDGEEDSIGMCYDIIPDDLDLLNLT